MIEIRDLTKFYGSTRALGPLSFEIAKGEVVGLLGLNGAGKTTTLRVLACDLLPSSGSVLVDGYDVVESPDDVRARIGYLPDTPPLYEDMSVEAYLGFAARLRRVPRSDVGARVAQAMASTELTERRHSPIASLSHGFKQRVGIAQAIVHEPSLLVLDEPISGLDPVQIVEMRSLLRKLRGKHTIVVSSHILTEISETCDRILVIREGLIAAQGTEKELTRSMTQGMRLEAIVRGPLDAAARAVRELPGVTACEALQTADGGYRETALQTLRITTDGDLREEIAKTLVAHGLLELRRRERELESVFLEVAGRAGPEPGTSAAAPPRPDLARASSAKSPAKGGAR